MARTGRPAVRHVAAVERAFSVLDALADGGELGTNEIARRTGINASTVSRLLATLASARFVEHVTETGRYRLSLRLVELGNAVLGRLDLRALARPHCRRSCARRVRRRRFRARRARRDHRRLRAQRLGRAERRPARPSEIGHATAAARSCSRSATSSFPPAPLTVVHAADDRDPRQGSPRSSSGCGGAASPRPGRSVKRIWRRSRPPCAGSRGELVGIIGVQGPASRFDAAAARAACGSCWPRRAPGGRLARARAGSGAARAAAYRGLGRQPDEAGRPLADPLRQLRVAASLQPLAVGSEDEEPGRARRRARAARRSAAGCTASAAPRRPRARCASAAGARNESSTSSVPTYSYPIASEIGPSGTSAALTMISGWPDSTAGSTANAVASGSNGTSKVTSITGRAPETAGRPRSTGASRSPRTRITRAAAASSACWVRT